MVNLAHGISAHYRDQPDPRKKAAYDLAKAREKITEETLGASQDAIAQMNKEYAVAWAGGGDVVILREYADPTTGRDEVAFAKYEAIKKMLANHHYRE